jgi:DNA-binding MarR family transcriptional regulator
MPAPLEITADEEVPIVSRLLSIAKLTRAMLGLKLAEIDLCAGQDQLLSVFQGTTRASISTLANAVSVRPSTVSKMVDRLIEKGLMQRFRDPNDARTTLVELTPLGQHQQQMVADIWHAVERDLTKSLASGEIDNLRGELEKVDGLLTAKMSRLR